MFFPTLNGYVSVYEECGMGARFSSLIKITLKFLCMITEIHFEPVIRSQSYFETFW